MTTPALDPKSPLAPSRWDIPLLGGVLLGGAFLLFYLNYTAWVGPLWDGDADSPDCLPTKAVVTGGDKKTGSGTSYALNYTYEVEGKTIKGYTKVASHIYDGSNIGDTIDICYMKGHPTWSAIPGSHPGENELVALGLDLLLLSGLVKLIRAELKKRKAGAAPR